MLEDAKVVTSKFLQLKNELDTNIRMSQTKMCADLDDAYKMVLNIHQSFDELCLLLHELTMKEGERK